MPSVACQSCFQGGDDLDKIVISTDSRKKIVIQLVHFKEMLTNIFDTYTIWSFVNYNQIIADAGFPPRYAAEQKAERPVIWNVMRIIWRHCINNATKRDSALQMITSPVRECGCFVCYKLGHADEQIVDRLMVWNVMTLMLCHCNNSATKRIFGITNDQARN